MAKLNIAGVVQYADLSPVHGAVVKIIDLDEGGNGNDIILEDVTDAGGKFKKQSKEWIDLNNVKIRWNSTVYIPDMLALQFRVEKDDEIYEGPFLYVGDDVLVPILTPWQPPSSNREG